MSAATSAKNKQAISRMHRAIHSRRGPGFVRCQGDAAMLLENAWSHIRMDATVLMVGTGDGTLPAAIASHCIAGDVLCLDEPRAEWHAHGAILLPCSGADRLPIIRSIELIPDLVLLLDPQSASDAAILINEIDSAFPYASLGGKVIPVITDL